jgi:hypothetical protein
MIGGKWKLLFFYGELILVKKIFSVFGLEFFLREIKLDYLEEEFLGKVFFLGKVVFF